MRRRRRVKLRQRPMDFSGISLKRPTCTGICEKLTKRPVIIIFTYEIGPKTFRHSVGVFRLFCVIILHYYYYYFIDRTKNKINTNACATVYK